ncbi:MAG: aldehyde ferredoxin oxidoreductase [Deltaproteobacteria bacterium]|nr:aldehyde ferredoxin oxidoreductase [Deltaproteobacteria bacterium]
MKILRVNMSNLEVNIQDLPVDWTIIGGRGLCAKILKAEVPPQCDPLGPEAKLIITTGPLAGTLAPSCGRISVGAKSPLTLGIKEANSGGTAGQKMDRLGIRAIIVEGMPQEGKMHLLHITKDGAVLKPADQYRGLKNYALTEALYEKFDPKSSIASIGIGGERRWKSSSVAFTDTLGHPARHAARGGLGAVMGSKGLKAIILDDRGAKAVDMVDMKAHRELIKEWAKVIKADPKTKGTRTYGTPGLLNGLRTLGSTPSKNYSSEPTEGFEKLGGESIEKTNQERGGGLKGCMAGCLVQCSTVYYGPDGQYLTSGFEYETLGLLGTNLGITDPDAVARFDRWCDEMGVDTIEIGSALGVAASAGKMTFGDIASADTLFAEIEKGTEFGSILADGVVSTCKALGITRIPAYKGQAIPAHDPRVTKATGVTYVTSPMGADHTAGVTYENLSAKSGHVELSLKVQITNALLDTLGYCVLATIADGKAQMVFLRDLLNARYGLNLEVDDLYNMGRDVLRTELEFNKGTEFYSAYDPDSDFMRTEPSAPMGTVFDVDPDEIAVIWEKLDTIAM